MPIKRDMDATTGTKLLRLFQRLMLDGNRHFQRDLAEWLNCSSQTISRLIAEIEGVIGTSLQSGMEGHRRWYQICPSSRRHLGLDFEELRYLRVCRELAEPYLPEQIRKRVDDSIFRFSILMADASFTNSSHHGKPQFAFFSKGRIDYTPYFGYIDQLLQAQETRKVCLVHYTSAGKNNVKAYHFAVSRMISMNNALYVLGAEIGEDFTTISRMLSLAVHRIKDVILTDKPVTFEIPDADPGTFGLPWHEPRTFRIRFAPGKASDYVRERIWAESQRMEDTDDGGVLLEIVTRSEPELMAWVRSFGDKATLL